jgi:hypothetical protein
MFYTIARSIVVGVFAAGAMLGAAGAASADFPPYMDEDHPPYALPSDLAADNTVVDPPSPGRFLPPRVSWEVGVR